MNRKTEIFSIFGQIEAVAAEIMLERGEIGPRIQFDEIPPTAQVNQLGRLARFAVVVPGNKVGAFNKLCEELRW